MNRREFLKTGLALFATPAIVKAENIMDIFVPKDHGEFVITPDFGLVQSKREGGVYVFDWTEGCWTERKVDQTICDKEDESYEDQIMISDHETQHPLLKQYFIDKQ